MSANWTVVSQRKTSAIGADGRFADVIEVTFRTAGGVTSSIDVPVDRYTADNVRALIDAQVVHLDAVQNL